MSETKNAKENKNSNLHKAKSAKNDEFYTLYESIQEELNHYTKHFEGKTVLCNCDDPYESNFCLFFLKNFNYLKLKRLICTSYKGSPVVDTQVRLFDDEFDEPMTKECAYVLDVKEIPMENGRGVSDDDIYRLLHKKRNGKVVRKLKGDGDFQSKECIKLLKEADIVVTNPPFSKFRDFVATLVEYDKKFIIWGNNNAITYKEIFPLIKENKMWLGYCANKTCVFQIPEHYEKYDEKETKKRNDGHKYCKVPAISVFTNLEIPKRNEELFLYRKYTAEEYPTYDNYDAINVDKVADIPCDYDGVMGVPITFLDKYNPEQFEIVTFRKGEDGKDLVFTREREREFNRTFVSLYDIDSRDDKKCRRENQWKEYLRKDNNSTEIEPIDYFFPQRMAICGLMNNPKDTVVNNKSKYARVLIMKKEENCL